MKKLMHRIKSFLKDHQKNKKAFTLLETVAAITIISLVLVSAFTIAINTRTQVLAQERRIIAQQEISLIRTEVMARINAQEVKSRLEDPDYNGSVLIQIEKENESLELLINENQTMQCTDDVFGFICDIFLSDISPPYVNVENVEVSLTLEPGIIDILRVNVSVRYHLNREPLTVEGIVFIQES